MKVSVLMLAYNHEPFVAQSIESVLKQKTNFPFEVIIGEDCSTDRTREIVLQFQYANPEKVRVITSEHNVGAKKNFERVFRACTGQYIASLEGDDYWLMDDKMQKQVNFLDAHPECSICAHNTRFIRASDGQFVRNALAEGQRQIFYLQDILKKCFIQTSSVVIRSGLINEFPNWYYEFPGVDWPLFIMLSHYGNIGYLDEVMSVYRIHPGGMWSGSPLTDRYSDNIRLYQAMYNDLEPEIRHTLLHILPDRFEEAAGVYLSEEFPKGYSSKALIQGGEHFLQTLLDQVNTNIFSKQAIKRKYWKGFYTNLGFLSYWNGNPVTARSNMMKAIWHDPSSLRNRGVLSILGRSFLGEVAVKYLLEKFHFD